MRWSVLSLILVGCAPLCRPQPTAPLMTSVDPVCPVPTASGCLEPETVWRVIADVLELATRLVPNGGNTP